jgi:hypothetical protein
VTSTATPLDGAAQRAPADRPSTGTGVRLDLLLKLVTLGVMAATAVHSVVVPRALYADGSYFLWQVLQERSFVVIGAPRAFALYLNEAPVVLGLHLGVSDLDVLVRLYSFGVAAVPTLIWMAALLVHRRRREFWPLAAIYAATALASGFFAVGEYNHAFALAALITSILLTPSFGARAAVALGAAATAFILCYQGASFLGLPLIALAGVRLVRRHWVTPEPAQRHERAATAYALGCSALAVAVGGGAILLRLLSRGDDPNLSGAMDVSVPLELNEQWRLAAVAGLLFVVCGLFRRTVPAIVATLVATGLAVALFRESVLPAAWLQYNTRTLANYTITALLFLVVGLAIHGNRRVDTPPTDVRRDVPSPAPGTRTRELALAVGVTLLVASMSFALATLTHRYGIWLDRLQTTAQNETGLIDIATRPELYNADNGQFSWDWTNPYTSALLQSGYGQAIVLSPGMTPETFEGMTPDMTADFFSTYHRDAAG